MKLMVRNNKTSDWKPLKQSRYDDEDHLQRLLFEAPLIIPTQDLGDGKGAIQLVVREMGLVGSGNTDLTGLDVHGNIYIIETKLAKNPEIKREVVGQILEYAAFLWNKSYEEFDTLIFKRAKKHIAEFFDGKCKDWDEEVFRENVKRNLQTGSFSLFIVVDEINEDLRRTTEFLNQSLEIEINALVLRYFQNEDGTEIIMPQIFGNKSITRSSSIALKNQYQWDEAAIFNALLALPPEESGVFKELYEFGKEIGEVKFGVGQGASFSVRAASPASSLTLYQVLGSGKLNIYLPGLKKEKLNQVSVAAFIQKLKSIYPSIQIEENWHNHFAIIPLFVLTNRDALESLFEALRTLITSW